MADNENEAQKRPRPLKKKGLPPISPRENEENENARPVKRKPRKKAQPLETTAESDEVKPTPVRRRKHSPSQTKKAASGDATAGDVSTVTPKKKKKKPKQAEAEDPDESQNPESPKPRDGQGSKTSLISKDGETPRKKTGVKKKKRVKKAVVVEEDEYGDSPWAEDLRTMHDDIISGGCDGEADEEEEGLEGEKTGSKKMTKMFVTAPILKSQPLDKIFVETSNKFKGQMKSTMKQQHYEDPSTTVLPQEVSRITTADFAISTNAIFRTISLFLHGLTAGLALWQMVIILVLTSFSSDDFLEHYYETAMPLQGCLYFLLAVCTVSVCDRFDIGNPNRRFVLRAITMQNGAVSIIFCLAALVLNVVCIRYEDRMSLYKHYKDLLPTANVTVTPEMITTPLPELVKDDEISTFRGINTARSICIMLSWLVLSITPNCDRLGQSLRSGRTGLEKEVEMDKVSSA